MAMSNLNGVASVQDVPHVESLECEHSYSDLVEEGIQISEDCEVENDNEVAVYSNAPPQRFLSLLLVLKSEEQRQAHRADKFVGPVPLNEECVRNPNVSGNKGCCSRIKSSREISIQSKGQLTCSICNKTEGHNARTCPTLKKSNEHS